MKKITKAEWDKTHKDYKGYVKGIPYMLINEKGATISVPVQIDDLIDNYNESYLDPDEVWGEVEPHPISWFEWLLIAIILTGTITLVIKNLI